jgi:hypothetical protein
VRDIAYPYPKATVQNCQEHEPGSWVTEAAELGLEVGEWPIHIKTDLGNGMDFVKRSHDLTPSGDLAGVRYTQGNGVTLLVIND